MKDTLAAIKKAARNPQSLKPKYPRQWVGLVLVGLILIAGGWWIWQQPFNQASAEGLNVSATYYPLADIAQHVGGDHVTVTTITPTGQEPHDYEPTPQQLADIQNSSVLLYNGANFEPWVPDFLSTYHNQAVAVNNGMTMLVGGHEHDQDDGTEPAGHEHGAYEEDPHYWMDPVLMQQATRTVRDAFITADPANAAYYATQAEAYISRLHALDSQYRQGLASCQQNAVVSSHDSISYMAARYNFMVWPIAGFDPESEPSPATLAELSQTMQIKGITTVLLEPLASPRLAQTLAREVGAETAVIDPLEGLSAEQIAAGEDYLSVQEKNLATLREVLQCQ